MPKWTKNEEKMLAENLHLSMDQLMEIIPDRSRRQILCKIRYIGHRWRFEKVQERSNRTLELSETEKAYIAGLIDGEGSIGLTRGKRRDLAPRVSIANNRRDLLEWLKDKLCIGYISRREYECQYYDVKPLLEAVLPYLKLKQRQAILLLEFIDLRLSRETWWSTSTKRELEIRREMLNLNEKPKMTKRFASSKEVAEYLNSHEKITAPGGE